MSLQQKISEWKDRCGVLPTINVACEDLHTLLGLIDRANAHREAADLFMAHTFASMRLYEGSRVRHRKRGSYYSVSGVGLFRLGNEEPARDGDLLTCLAVAARRVEDGAAGYRLIIEESYELLGGPKTPSSLLTATLQSKNPVKDGDVLVRYTRLPSAGQPEEWLRPVYEFVDGRFEFVQEIPT